MTQRSMSSSSPSSSEVDRVSRWTAVGASLAPSDPVLNLSTRFQSASFSPPPGGGEDMMRSSGIASSSLNQS